MVKRARREALQADIATAATAMARNKIFISYRRIDTEAHVQGIAQYLGKKFGTKRVLLDVDMPPGTEYPKALEAWLSECRVLLVLIGPGWLDARLANGERRLDQPDDWVKLEVARALARNIKVIPVLIGDAAPPGREQLPVAIAALADCQVAYVRPESFANDMAGLAKTIAKYLGMDLRWLAVAAAALLLVAAGSVWSGNGWYPLAVAVPRADAPQNSPLGGPQVATQSGKQNTTLSTPQDAPAK
jgi:hypothetical protein